MPSNIGQAGWISWSAPSPSAAQRPATASISSPTAKAGGSPAISAPCRRDLWNSLGPVEFVYRRPAAGGVENRLAFANVFRLPSGYRLIVGRDIEDRRELARMVRSAMLWGLGVMALFGIGGGYWVSRKLLARIDALSDTTRTIMEGDLTGRLPVNGSGDELDRLAAEPQSHAGAHRAADGGLARGLRQYRARPEDAAQPLAQSRRGGVARALRRAGLSRGAGAHHRRGRRADQDLQRAAVDRPARGGRRRREPRDARRVGAAARRGRALRAGRRGARAGAEGRDEAADLHPRRPPAARPGHRQSHRQCDQIRDGRGRRERPRRQARSRGERRGQGRDGRDRGHRSRARRAGFATASGCSTASSGWKRAGPSPAAGSV